MPFTVPSSFCGCSPLSGHSLQARNCDTVELAGRGTELQFAAAAPMSALATEFFAGQIDNCCSTIVAKYAQP